MSRNRKKVWVILFSILSLNGWWITAMASSFEYANSRLWAIFALVLVAITTEAIIVHPGLKSFNQRPRKRRIGVLRYSVVGFVQDTSFFVIYFAGLFAIVNSNIPGIGL